jgi:hypothetical protein
MFASPVLQGREILRKVRSRQRAAVHLDLTKLLVIATIIRSLSSRAPVPSAAHFLASENDRIVGRGRFEGHWRSGRGTDSISLEGNLSNKEFLRSRSLLHQSWSPLPKALSPPAVRLLHVARHVIGIRHIYVPAYVRFV